MAFSATPQNSHPLLNPPSSSFSFLSIKPQTHFHPFLKPLNLNPCCSQNTAQTQTETQTKQPQHIKINFEAQKKKRKPKPSFCEQIRGKWSQKPIYQTKKLPWQQQQQEKEEKEEGPFLELDGAMKMVSDPENFDVERSKLYGEFVDRSKIEEPIIDFERNFDQKSSNVVNDPENVDVESSKLYGQLVDRIKIEEPIIDFERNVDKKSSNVVNDPVSSGLDSSLVSASFAEKDKNTSTHFGYGRKSDQNFSGNSGNDLGFSGDLANDLALENLDIVDGVEVSGNDEGVQEKEITLSTSKFDVQRGSSLSGNNNVETKGNKASVEGSAQEKGADRLPWMQGNDTDKEEEEKRQRSKTELAEKMIPEHELKRLRNVALRMKERIKVGAGGVTQALVDNIHEKWKIDEVVKLKFEGPSSLNMKRIHDILEGRTGGLVIWRSGSSVVLYRGLNYKLGCVQTYVREKGVNLDASRDREPDSVRLPKDLSEEELMSLSEFNNLLVDLGPRYKDWSGRPPLPVDADLLPGFVRGYKTPFRLLPHGVRRSLRDEETTHIRKLARTTPPHFALGRNRELQGLAAAMVKLWEKSAIAKIAIKRGVLNTNNERMAEQLKRLTGGTLLSRNKEYIVFYRGNDFMTPSVTEALKERERLTMLQYQEEEERRYASALIHSSSANSKTPMVAGTLAETVAATSRWGNQPSREEAEEMLKDLAKARHASLVKYLEKKLAKAKGKVKKAERALAKVQESLAPEELPTDLETITDEERLVFRKMGLSMKPHLLVGRREVFDGTIENMHLHWKFRELVKIIVRGKNFSQAKHMAISLEAESGGVLVSLDKTTKGYAIIIYRGKNYQRPLKLRPRNLLTRRQALARSIELQRREGLQHHIAGLEEQIELLKSGLDDMKDGNEIDDITFYEKLDDSVIPSDDDTDEDEDEDEDEEAYLQTYDSGDENAGV